MFVRWHEGAFFREAPDKQHRPQHDNNSVILFRLPSVILSEAKNLGDASPALNVTKLTLSMAIPLRYD
ncbi:MAG: hypothetical protein C4335_06745 [Armatimonadota bacterium]